MCEIILFYYDVVSYNKEKKRTFVRSGSEMDPCLQRFSSSLIRLFSVFCYSTVCFKLNNSFDVINNSKKVNV